VNYSELYSLPPSAVEKHVEEDRRAQRQYHASSSDSRSSDSLVVQPRHLDGSGRRPHHGGGIRLIEPPNRRKDTYFYYSENSPHYRGVEDGVVKKNRKRVVVRRKDETATKKKKKFKKKRFHFFNGGKRNEGEEREEELLEAAPSGASAVIYSVADGRGQRRKVGVVYSSSRARDLFTANVPPSSSVPLPPSVPIPISSADAAGPPTRPPALREPSHEDVVSGRLTHVHHGRPRHIPLDRPRGARREVYPLGNPYGSPAVHSLPNYFPAQSHPPIYKTRPKKLEGVFGPALPPKPAPTHLHFPGEGFEYQPQQDYLYDRRRQDYDQQQEQQREEQKQYYPESESFQRREDSDWVVYQDEQPREKVQQPLSLQSPQPRRDDGVVYKTVRDMDYTRPPVILHVRDSGELFVPGSEVLDPIVQPDDPTATLINTPLEELRRRRDGLPPPTAAAEGREAEADPLWLADFSDAYKDEANAPPPPASPPRPKPKRQVGLPAKDSAPKLVFREEEEQEANRPAADDRVREVVKSQAFSFPERQEVLNKIRRGEEESGQKRRQPAPTNGRVRQSQQKRRQEEEGQEAGHEETVTPNYKVVYGARYSDLVRQQKKKEPQPAAEEKGKLEKKYSKEELYQLCVKEVPGYLRRQLCQHVLDDGDGDDDRRRISRVIEKPPQQEKQQPKTIKSVSKVKVYRAKENPSTTNTTTTTSSTTTTTSTTTSTSSAKRENLPEPQEKEKRPRRPPPQMGAFLRGLTAFFKQRLRPQPRPTAEEGAGAEEVSLVT